MSEFIVGLLVLLPFVTTALALVVLWSTISRKVLFGVASVLALLGIQGLAAPAAVGMFLPGSGGLKAAALHEAFLQSLWLSGGFVLTLGSLFIWWLSYAFRKAEP